MNKFFKILFLFLLIIIIGEMSYFFYIQNLFSLPFFSSNSSMNELVKPTLNDKSDKEIRSNLTRQKLINEKVLYSSIVINRLKTVLISYKFQNRPKKALFLTIKSGEKESLTYFYTESYISRIKVFEIINGKEKEINLSDLKPGDQIEMEFVFDNLNPNSDIISLKIIKI